MMGCMGKTPLGQSVIDKVQRDILEELRKSMIKPLPDDLLLTGLPEEPVNSLSVLMDTYAGTLDGYDKSLLSGTVYNADTQLDAIAVQTFGRFLHANPLHPDVFGATRRMEADIIRMVAGLYTLRDNAAAMPAGKEWVGCVTSGGTESILLACKAYRDRALAERSISRPEMVVPSTAHVAFDKAAHLLGIKTHHARVNDDGTVDLKDVQRLLNANTVMIAGSMPCFPYGTADAIGELAEMAARHHVGLHVDGCLGSFYVPMMLPELQRTCNAPGVTSLSCDTHKVNAAALSLQYGFTPKGTSVLLYADKELLSYQYYVNVEWCGGMYASPCIAGSRSGALIAATWATMLAYGQRRYRAEFEQIGKKVRAVVEGVEATGRLKIIGKPLSTVVAFKAASDLDVYELNDQMSSLGWHLSALQHPPALHIAVTALTDEQRFLGDLSTALALVEKSPAGNAKKGSTATMYGTSQRVPAKGIVEQLARSYLHLLYEQQ